MKRLAFAAVLLFLAGCGGGGHPVSREISPLPPSQLMGAAAPGGVQINWNASYTPGIRCYRIYRGTSPQSRTLIGESTQSSYTDTTLESGNTYYYSVTAVKGETESGHSDQLIWGT